MTKDKFVVHLRTFRCRRSADLRSTLIRVHRLHCIASSVCKCVCVCVCVGKACMTKWDRLLNGIWRLETWSRWLSWDSSSSESHYSANFAFSSNQFAGKAFLILLLWNCDILKCSNIKTVSLFLNPLWLLVRQTYRVLESGFFYDVKNL